jgi:hypothetical protein
MSAIKWELIIIEILSFCDWIMENNSIISLAKYLTDCETYDVFISNAIILFSRSYY